eukprot:9251628-Prorocentrum_lima.AAC.1
MVSDDDWDDFVDALKKELPDIADEIEKALRDFKHDPVNHHEMATAIYHLWLQAIQKGFEHYDADGNGEVDKEEIKKFAEELEQEF